jgi:hypothetical protein
MQIWPNWRCTVTKTPIKTKCADPVKVVDLMIDQKP